MKRPQREHRSTVSLDPSVPIPVFFDYRSWKMSETPRKFQVTAHFYHIAFARMFPKPPPDWPCVHNRLRAETSACAASRSETTEPLIGIVLPRLGTAD